MARRRRQAHELERVLGANALFSTAYGNVGSSIYYALGVTAAFALGLTPVVYLLHLLAVIGYITVAGHKPAVHPLMELAQQRPAGNVWLMV